ncbi:hypothetical protein [Mucilaginibacter glaciei]|uniref:Outer membrane lipoprotein carrier protein LolA n=1 Tax=Mucilaginibacter glaciei TaxID=2772109 RepID=A0A926NPJ6_9SPHI|nr:hypothetical protein [Mucilaginibacter glaciei]MBD1393556.1 hypothetical protein [Mucilaginibacter glaciei]
MKKISIFLFLTLVLFSTAFSQTKTELLKFNQLYLTFKGKQVKFSSLNDRTIISLLGHPIKISKKPWETAGTNKVKTYYYKGFEVSTVMGSLEFINITGKGASFSFLINKTISKPFSVGSSADLIKRYFPKSFAEKDQNGVFVIITDSSGIEQGESIRFSFSGNNIKTVEYAVNES